MGASGLGAFNGIVYLRHGFDNFSFLNSEENVCQTIITGQNADTLFHVDHFGPTNRTGGLQRIVEIIKSIKFRMVYSMPFYKGSLSIQLLSQFKSINYRKRTLGSLLMPSLIGLGEHKYPFQVSDKEKDPVSQSILKYKIKYYYDVLSDYFFKKYNISIDDSKIKT